MRLLIFCCCLLLLVSSCKKTKLDHEMEHLTQFSPGELSAVRLINTAEYEQAVVNGYALTNFITRRGAPRDNYVIPGDSYWSEGYPGTDYFPINGYIGREWRIPKQLFRENGRLDMFLYSSGVGFGWVDKLGITINLNGNKPVDYYLGAYENGREPYFVADRDETPPSKPGYFKIRIINLSVPIQAIGNASGQFRDLSGPVTLTFADGTPVDPKTTGVNYSKRVSDYVELPYGKYEFRVLNAAGRQLPGTDGTLTDMTIDPPTASTDLSFTEPNYLVYAPIHSYQPGGTYTILVYPNLFRTVMQATPPIYAAQPQNAFRVIEDSRTPANTQFSRVQGFNAIPGQRLRLRINGKKPSNSINFGAASDYEIIQSGKSQIAVLNADGSVMAEQEYTFQSNQNYTMWAYPGAADKPQIVIVANDLSGEGRVGNNQESTLFYRNPDNYPFLKRFLNLCPDISYLTFTFGNGQSLGGTEVSNLQPGIPVLQSPYVGGTNGLKSYELLAYRSAPGLIPGIWADDIAGLRSQDFIANKTLYTRIGSQLPVHEPGYFTVAVIGRVGAQVPADQKARMVILKHNK